MTAVPTFVHIDHSLCRVGGHEFDCAVNLLTVAQAAGFQVALATNQVFQDRSGLLSHWPVRAAFPYKTLARRRAAVGGRSWGWLRSLGETLLRTLAGRAPHERSAAEFAAACRTVFRQIPLAEGDQVFFASIALEDLPGLVQYLVDDPRSALADWHLQFHEDILQDIDPTSSLATEAELAAKSVFAGCLSRVPDHRLHFYNPAEGLVAQYNELGTARFQYLPFPVSPSLQASSRNEKGPLCVTCAGGVRREKGYQELQQLVEALRRDPVFHGQIRLAIQSPERKLRRLGLSKTTLRSGRDKVELALVRHPLPIDEYQQLIRQTDVGLFLYVGQRYRLRCSGVLQEMLSVGRPVIVPANTWLAAQVSEPIFCHLETLRQTFPLVQHIEGCDVAWRRSGQDGCTVLSADGGPWGPAPDAWAEWTVPESACELLVTLRQSVPASWSGNTWIGVEQFDWRGTLVRRFDSILGRRAEGKDLLALFRLDPKSARIVLRLQFASWKPAGASLQLDASFLDSRRRGGCPAGSVGLIAARPSHIPELLRDMVEHYAHYRESAERFAELWRSAHDPARTLETLTQCARQDARSMASQRVA